MSITTAVRSLNRSALKKFPGSTTADIAEYLNLVFQAAAKNLRPDFKDEDAVTAADRDLAVAAENGEAWAERLRDSVLMNVVKPIVDKANSKGVDPVQALIFADFTEEQACDYVNALDSRVDTDAAGEADSEGEGDTAPVQAEPVPVG